MSGLPSNRGLPRFERVRRADRLCNFAYSALACFRLGLSDHLPSLHMLAEIDQQLVGGFEPNQARTRVLDVEHDVDDYYREDGETEDVEPTPVLATRHPKTSQ